MIREYRLPIDVLRRVLSYDPETGIFVWNYRPEYEGSRSAGWNAKYAGSPAGATDDDGYIVISIKSDGVKRMYFAHQLAWAYEHGVFVTQIDHRNRMKGDNRISNLREADTAQNGWNVGLQSRNTSGVKGVYWHKIAKKWCMHVTVRGSYVYLGLCHDLELAAAIVHEASEKYHGEFAGKGI